MASYAEYAKKQDALDNEISDAAAATQDRKDNPESQIPERFRNKSAEDIAQSYVELEKKFSQQGNDLGQMRKTLDEFIRLQSEAGVSNNKDPEQDEKPKTIDDLYSDTEGTIRDVVDKAAGDRLEKVEKELAEARLKEELEELSRDFPSWQKDTQSEQFIEWIKKDPIRQQTALIASQHNNTAAARSLIGTWYEVQAARTAADKAQRESALRDGALEGSGGSHGGTSQVFSRRALMDKRIAAKRGDDSAQQYLIDNREAIAIAYEEGRISD
jgi:hypothetical protein